MIKRICILLLVSLGVVSSFAANKKAPAKKPVAKKEAVKKGTPKKEIAKIEVEKKEPVEAVAAPAAEAFPKQVIGVRLGGNVSKITSFGNSSAHITGFTVGGSYQINVVKEMPVYVETGLYWTRKGYQLIGFEESESKLHYIEVPATINYHVGKHGAFEVIPQVGGYASVGIKGDLKTKPSTELGTGPLFASEHKYEVFKDGAMKRFDAGLRFGMDIVIWRIQAGFAYDLGMLWTDKIDLIYGDDQMKFGYKKLKNRTMQFTIGYNF